MAASAAEQELAAQKAALAEKERQLQQLIDENKR